MECPAIRNPHHTPGTLPTSTLIKETAHKLAAWQIQQHNPATNHALCQAVPAPAIPSHFLSGQSHPVPDIRRNDLLHRRLHHDNVRYDFHERHHSDSREQNPRSGQFHQRRLYTLCSIDSRIETPAINQKEDWFHVGIHDWHHVCATLLAIQQWTSLIFS